MHKLLLKIMGIVFVFFLTLAPGLAGTQIQIIGGDFIWPKFSAMSLESLSPHAQTIRTIDPNFKEDGVTAFTGIGIKKLFDLAGVPWEKGITILGADQYVGYLSHEQILQDMAVLVWQANDKPLGKLKGGPLKIMFPDQSGVHASCYTWYVDTLIAGPMDQAALTVQVNGNQRFYTRENLDPMAEELSPGMLSIPQGCRAGFTGQKPAKNIYAVPLSRLVHSAETKKAGHITLIPITGRAITLKSTTFDYPVSIVVSCDKDALPPALGGPFSVIFPVEQFPELKGLVPESGALFFLEKIIIE